MKMPPVPQIIEDNHFFKYAYYLLLIVFSFIIVIFVLVKPFVGKTQSEMHQNISDWFSRTFSPVKNLMDNKLASAYIDNTGAVHTYITTPEDRISLLEQIGI